MAGWNVTTWQNADWSATANYKQFWEAFYERRLLVSGVPAGPVPADGADCQYGGTVPPVSSTDRFSLGVVQAWVISQVDTGLGLTIPWIQTHTAAGDPIDYNGGTLASVERWDAESFFKSMGCWKDSTHWGFRRATVMPADWTDASDPAWQWDCQYAPGYTPKFGLMQPGDIMGPWVFQDLQNALNRLKWLWGEFTWDAQGENNELNGFGDDAGWNWDSAKAAAEAAAGVSNNDMLPNRYTRGYEEPMSGDLEASITSRYSYPLLAGGDYNYPLPCIVECCIVGGESETANPPFVFDDNGDNIYNGFVSIAASVPVAAETALDVYGDAFGSTDIPNWCADPNGTGTQESSQGWGIVSTTAVARFDVAGGFTFY